MSAGWQCIEPLSAAPLPSGGGSGTHYLSPQCHALSAQAVGLLFTPESPVWLEGKGRKAAAMYNQHRLLGRHWQEEGEVGDLEQESLQPSNGDLDGQVRGLLLSPRVQACLQLQREQKFRAPTMQLVHVTTFFN